jgi:sugar/nucleoside kinase (ribokinase family)
VILAIGEILVEFRRMTADGRLTTPGEWAGPFPSGAPAIFASAAARLGGDVALVASVGADAFGDALTARMARDGVVIDGLRVIPERSTAVAFVAYDDAGGRDFWFSVRDSAAVEMDRLVVDELAQRTDWLHVCGSTLTFGGATAEAIEVTAQRVLRAGGRVSLDPNLRPNASDRALSRTAELARVADVLFPSDGELEALGVAEAELTARGALICRTRGSAGATVTSDRDEQVHVAAPAVEEVDPTGAGDTFAAAFVTALRAGADPVAAARTACAIAARSVGVLGAMELPLERADLGAG